MKRSVAERILRDPEKFAHHDRVFLNNPVVMQGMGLAPLVVLATTGQNALMLAVAMALLLTPSRLLACLLSRLVPLRDEEPSKKELEAKLLARGILYSGSAAVVYLAVYPILSGLFGVDLLALGIYLPMLVVEPLLIYRFGRVQETLHKAFSKGLRITGAMSCCCSWWAACGSGWPWARCSACPSAARCCPWPICPPEGFWCWVCCALCGGRRPSSASVT